MNIQQVKTEPPAEYPWCPTCWHPMKLTRIEPDLPGKDLRTFECAECQHIDTRVIAFR